MIRQCTCRQCGIEFMGEPRATYCPLCRVERQREADKRHKERAKIGVVRKLGSADLCKVCGKSYTINGANQIYCPDCAPLEIAKVTREISLKWYHKDKDDINPERNERRHIGLIGCCRCGKKFDAHHTVRKYCSDNCFREAKNERWRERYHKNK